VLIHGRSVGLGRLLKRVPQGTYERRSEPPMSKEAAEARKHGFIFSPRAREVQPWCQGRVRDYTFGLDDSGWPEYLRQHGFCVLRDVLPADDMKQLEELFWSELEGVVPGLKRAKPMTWKFPRANGASPNGIVRSWGLPQSDFAWYVRLHQRVRQSFARIFGTQDLVVSMDSVKLDACDVSGPTPPWLHRDQLQDVEVYSVQGIFAFYEVGPRNAGTILIPGSHLEAYPWDEEQDGVSLLRAQGRQRNSVKVPKPLQKEFMACAIKPRVPDNGLILFNSRTIHASAPSSVVRWKEEAGKSLPRPNRVAVSVAMCPRSRRSNACLARKRRVYRNQGSTARRAPLARRVVGT